MQDILPIEEASTWARKTGGRGVMWSRLAGRPEIRTFVGYESMSNMPWVRTRIIYAELVNGPLIDASWTAS